MLFEAWSTKKQWSNNTHPTVKSCAHVLISPYPNSFGKALVGIQNGIIRSTSEVMHRTRWPNYNCPLHLTFASSIRMVYPLFVFWFCGFRPLRVCAHRNKHFGLSVYVPTLRFCLAHYAITFCIILDWYPNTSCRHICQNSIFLYLHHCITGNILIWSYKNTCNGCKNLQYLDAIPTVQLSAQLASLQLFQRLSRLVNICLHASHWWPHWITSSSKSKDRPSNVYSPHNLFPRLMIAMTVNVNPNNSNKKNLFIGKSR